MFVTLTHESISGSHLRCRIAFKHLLFLAQNIIIIPLNCPCRSKPSQNLWGSLEIPKKDKSSRNSSKLGKVIMPKGTSSSESLFPSAERSPHKIKLYNLKSFRFSFKASTMRKDSSLWLFWSKSSKNKDSSVISSTSRTLISSIIGI